METCRSKEPADQLIDHIDSYLKDKDNQYAIALEGDWGSGKTRFIEGKLNEYLEKGEYNLVRVSMFGIATADDLYERIVMALVHLSDKGMKAQAAAKTIGGALNGISRALIKRTGLSVNLAVGIQSVACLMLKKKHFLVFDDVERRSKHSDDLALFGTMNDLVERLGLKVMLVSNAWEGSDVQSMREFDRDVREKLIWKVYPFKPCPSALAKEILMGDCRPSEDLDMHSAILAGVEASGCVNARAMIRAHELIRRICSLEVLQNTGIALQNRFYALRDAVHFALLTSMGNAPSMPQNGKPEEWLSPEALEYDRRVSLYEQYSDFSVIGKAFDPSGDVDIEDLEQGFKTYIWKRYPSNRDTLEVREIAKSMRCAYDLDDDNVDGLAQRYYDLVTRAHYSVDCLHDVLEVYYLLSDLKWECPFSQNDFIKYCKKVIDADLDKASELLSGPVFSADERRKRRALAEELERYARTELDKKMSSQLMISEGAEGLTGREIARLLNDAAERDVKVLVNASPRVIVESFCREDAANQEALRKFFVHLHNVWIPGGVPSADLVEWILEIKTALEETNVETKTGSMRRRLFLRNLEELESRFGYPVQK